MLPAGLLFTILCLSFVKTQHVSLPRTPRDAECRTSDLRRIKDYFERTTIIRNQYTTKPKYCTVMNRLSKDSTNVSYPYPKIDLNTVIYLYTTLDYVNSFKYIDSEGPVVRDGFVSINDDDLLPLFEIADIRRKHLQCHDSNTGFGEDVDDQMSLMGRRKSDGRGHLLAHSLGGTSRALNVIPMAGNIYMHPHFETSTDLGEPLADWRSNEFWIRKFLKHFYPNGRVVWKMAVQYEDNVFVKPKQVNSYRPLSFSLQYTAYTDQYDITSVHYTSPNLTFLNDNHYECKPRAASSHDKDDGRSPPNCDIWNTKVKMYNYWSTKHFKCCPAIATFTYMLQGKSYLYVLYRNDSEIRYNTFINNIVNNNTATVEIFRTWLNSSPFKNFAYTFPYNMNGRQFMYGHCIDDKSYTIREFEPSGTEHETAKELWQKSHLTCAPFNISGKQYFYSQRTDKTWFIRELLPDGKMGDEKSNDKWPQVYTVVFAYVINSKLMLYAHNPESTEWFVRELLPDGRMGEQLNSGKWSIGYSQSLRLTLGERQYIYALSTEKPYQWFVRELLPNGEIGSILDSGKDDAKYDVNCDSLVCNQFNCIHYIFKRGSDHSLTRTDFLSTK